MGKIVETVSGFVWGYPTIFLLLFTGVFFTFRSRFFQFVYFKQIFKKTFSSIKKDGVSGFKAMSIALGGTIGIGNIAGVCWALHQGGPGAIFWMWITGFIGMMTKFSEISLSVEYSYYDKNNKRFGGPMIYMREGLPKKLSWLSPIFSFFCVCASFFVGNMTQLSSVAISLKEGFSLSRSNTAIIFIILIFLIVSGKKSKIENFSGLFVPIMSTIYIFATGFIIFSNIKFLPNAFCGIIKNAFGVDPIIGGFSGSVISQCIKTGITKGLFTNEAGMGSAPIAHAGAQKANPIVQGMWGIIEVFIDSIVVCSFTAFAVLCSNTYRQGAIDTGMKLMNKIFQETFGGFGTGYLSIAVSMFALASIVSWCFYGKSAVIFLSNDDKIAKGVYLFLFLCAVPMGIFLQDEIIWNLSDVFNGLMLLPNVISLLILSPVVFRIINRYKEGKQNQ